MNERASLKPTVAAAFAAAMLLLGLVSLFGASRAQAANGSCEAVGVGFHCYYSNGETPSNVLVYFDSGGENNRRWETNDATDPYGAGSHIAKCASLKRYDGVFFPEPSCGNAADQGVFLSAAWRPGYVFIEQYSGGPRLLNGNAYQE